MSLVRLSLRFEEYGPIEVKKRLLNQFVRDGLQLAGEFWVKEFLPMHFAQGATERYQYAYVSKVYAIIKNRARRVRPWIGRTRGGWVTAPKPVRPWVWSGATMGELLTKSPSEFNIKPRATASKQTVTVPLRVPHPVTSEHAGELGRLRPDEFEVMHQIAFDHIMEELHKIREIRTQEYTWDC
jgi:hypothetical protein